MSGCLAPPPLPVSSSPLVLYSSPLVIYSCRLVGAIITSLFTCFINVIIYFFSISEHISKTILPVLSVLIDDMFFQPIFSFKCLIMCQTHRPFIFHEGSSSCDFLNLIFVIYVRMLY